MELKEQLEQVHKAFDEYKKINDANVAEAKKLGQTSAAGVERLEKAEKHMQELEAKMEKMSAALARSAQDGTDGAEQKTKDFEKKSAQYSEEFVRCMKSGEPMSKEMKTWAKENLEAKLMSVDSDTDGGFLVNPTVSAEIVKQQYESSPIRQLASQLTIGGASLKILQDLDEAGAEWVGELEAGTNDKTPQLKEVEIFIHKMRTSPKASEDILEDAGINLEAWLSGKWVEKFSRAENTAFMTGDGVKKPKGILDYASGTGFGQVQRELTAANNAIAGDDFIDLQTLLKSDYDANAVWMINRLIVGAIRKLKDSVTGAYIWQPSLQLGVPALLLGKPVYYASDLDSTISANKFLAVYGDFKAGYQIIDKPGIRVLRDPYSSTGYVTFKTTKRVGGGVKNFEALKTLQVTT